MILHIKKSNVKHIKEVDVDENIALLPLTIPIIADPGTIVSVINFSSDANNYETGIIILIFAFCLNNLIIKGIGNNVTYVIGKLWTYYCYNCNRNNYRRCKNSF